MQQIKLFKGIESESEALEREINGWISSSGVAVIQITANIAPQTVASPKATTSGRQYTPSDVFVAVLYETT